MGRKSTLITSQALGGRRVRDRSEDRQKALGIGGTTYFGVSVFSSFGLPPWSPSPSSLRGSVALSVPSVPSCLSAFVPCSSSSIPRHSAAFAA